MKRLIPLWITAVAGFVLIVSFFIPVTQGWGEVAAIWFDILAAIAFVLGGGNLLKIHLKKTSDRAKGWGYSVVTAVAFLTMLTVGLGKIGTRPAPKQEFYGERFARLPVESIPDNLVFSVGGSIPQRPDGEEVHAVVRKQLFARDGELRFRGWMLPDQLGSLKGQDVGKVVGAFALLVGVLSTTLAGLIDSDALTVFVEVFTKVVMQ